MNLLSDSQRRLPLMVIALLGILLFALPTMAADNGLTILSVSDGDTQQEYSVKLQILLLMTALSFLPAFVLMATSFTRIIVVLRFCVRRWGCNKVRRTVFWLALHWH